jgi:hypothetical protein
MVMHYPLSDFNRLILKGSVVEEPNDHEKPIKKALNP